jgi:NAD(P)-dependent dehydrogenase (short-subunit alcohol dehydrogenase family)
MKIEQLFDVAGKACIVTGGASGIGLAIAEVLLANGAKVAIFDLDAPKLTEAGDRLSRLGASFLTKTVNVADETAMITAVADVAARFDGLDVAFLNAGIGGGPPYMTLDGERNPPGAIENLDVDAWIANIDVNLGAAFVGLKAVTPIMRKQQSGSIIVTSSVAAVKTENFVGAPYIAAKAGVAHLVRQTALELARYNVRVNAIAPGSFLTNMGGGRMSLPHIQARFARANPMRRMGDPAEIRGLALLLASRASSYMTGGQFLIDGAGSLGNAD